MIRRLGSVTLAAVAVAGTCSAVVPQHAASLASLFAAVVAVVAAAFVVVVAGTLAGPPPEPWPAPAARSAAPPLDPQGLRDARRAVAAELAAGTDPRRIARDPHQPTHGSLRP